MLAEPQPGPRPTRAPSPALRAAAIVLLLSAAAAALALAASLAFTPDQIARGEHFSLLGLAPSPCPGCAMCGLSRAFASASRLDLAAALALNPLVLLLYPAALLTTLGGPLLAVRLFRRT